MSMISRGIVISLATLIITVPSNAISAESGSEVQTSTTGNAELAAFISAVVDADPQVNAARAALDASVALVGAAGRPLYNPELELVAENADTKTRAIGISQTFDWGGKRNARTSVAESEQYAVEAEYKITRWQVMTELLSALATYQTEADRTALATTRVSTMRDFAELAERRFDAGDISQIELDLAALAFTDARMKQATALANVAESKQLVGSLAVGSAPSEWPAVKTQLSPMAIAPSEATTIVMSLPHVRVAQLRIAAAAARVDLRDRERRLDPTMTLIGGREDDENLVGLNVTIPLAVRNRHTYEVTAASAERRQAQQIAADVSRRAYARFFGAQDRYQLSLAAWQDWEKTGGVSLERQSELLRRLWESGELSTTEFLVQLRQTLDTRESALELRQTLWRAWFEWMTASGQIESWLGTGI